MPVTNWNTTIIDGKNYLVIEVAQLRIPLDWDPSSNVFIAVAAPTGGTLDYPALVQGDPGPAALFDSVVNLTALDYSDATADSASMTPLSPGLYQLNLTLHKGPPGTAAANVMHTATDLAGTSATGKIIVVNATNDGFVYATPKVGDRYVPATILPTPSGNPTFTLCPVAVPAQDFDWRPEVSGQCVVTGTGPDVRVDLIARLNSISGNIVGRAFGIAGQNPPTHVLSAGPPAGSADAYDKVLAGNTATIYLRAERQSGADTFTTSDTTTRFRVKVQPVP